MIVTLFILLLSCPLFYYSELSGYKYALLSLRSFTSMTLDIVGRIFSSVSVQNYLGWCYENGVGVVMDKAKAVEWYTKAAEQEDADAQSKLGWCYYNGDGVVMDKAKAVEWYRKAAEQGNAYAQYNLGKRYYNGDGVVMDKAKAVEWFTKAAEQGYARAQNRLREL